MLRFESITAVPLWSRMAGACGQPPTMEGAQLFISPFPDPFHIVVGSIEIVLGNSPLDCRIAAAVNLAPNDPEARRWLLKVVANEQEDYFDRRDAAGALAKFNGLTNSDLPAFQSLIFDSNPTFVGGPNVAVAAVSKIGTEASRAFLREALAFWEKSQYPEARKVREAISQALDLEDKTADLREILDRAGTDRWINTELPHVALEYVRRTPSSANELFISALRSYRKEEVYFGTLVWAVLVILPQIPMTDGLLEAAIDLARQLPQSTLPWSAISAVWQRRDISIAQRALFSQTTLADAGDGHTQAKTK